MNRKVIHLVVKPLLIFVFFSQSTLCQAQVRFPIDKMKATIRLFDTVLHFPLPSWIDKDTRKLKKEIMPKVSRKQLKNKFIFLALPHKQTVHNWTSLFGIEAFYVGNSNIPLSNLRRF